MALPTPGILGRALSRSAAALRLTAPSSCRCAGTPSSAGFLRLPPGATVGGRPPCHGSQVGTPERSSHRSALRTASGSAREYPAPKQAKQKQQAPLPEVLEADIEEADAFLGLALQSSFDAPPRHYEFVFLVGENRLEEIPQLMDTINDRIAELRGKIWRLNDWGLRPLAYKIQKCRKAHYFLLNVEISAEKANELNAFFQKEERVIRHLMTKKDKAETRDYPAPVLYNAPMDDDGGMDDDEEEGGDKEDDDEDWDEDDNWESDEDEEGEDDKGVERTQRKTVARGGAKTTMM